MLASLMVAALTWYTCLFFGKLWEHNRSGASNVIIQSELSIINKTQNNGTTSGRIQDCIWGNSPSEITARGLLFALLGLASQRDVSVLCACCATETMQKYYFCLERQSLSRVYSPPQCIFFLAWVLIMLYLMPAVPWTTWTMNQIVHHEIPSAFNLVSVTGS